MYVFFSLFKKDRSHEKFKSKKKKNLIRESRILQESKVTLYVLAIISYKSGRINLNGLRMRSDVFSCVLLSRVITFRGSGIFRRIFRENDKEFYILCIYRHIRVHTSRKFGKPTSRQGPLPEGCWSLSRHCGLGISPHFSSTRAT